MGTIIVLTKEEYSTNFKTSTIYEHRSGFVKKGSKIVQQAEKTKDTTYATTNDYPFKCPLGHDHGYDVMFFTHKCDPIDDIGLSDELKDIYKKGGYQWATTIETSTDGIAEDVAVEAIEEYLTRKGIWPEIITENGKNHEVRHRVIDIEKYNPLCDDKSNFAFVLGRWQGDVLSLGKDGTSVEMNTLTIKPIDLAEVGKDEWLNTLHGLKTQEDLDSEGHRQVMYSGGKNALYAFIYPFSDFVNKIDMKEFMGNIVMTEFRIAYSRESQVSISDNQLFGFGDMAVIVNYWNPDNLVVSIAGKYDLVTAFLKYIGKSVHKYNFKKMKKEVIIRKMAITKEQLLAGEM